MVDVRHRAAWLNRAVRIVARLAVLTLVLGLPSVTTAQAAPASAPAARHAVAPVAPAPTPTPAPAPAPAPPKPSCPEDIGTRTVVLLVHGYNSSEATWQGNAYSKLCDSRTYVNTFNYGNRSLGGEDPSLMWVDNQKIGPDLAKRIAKLSQDSKAQGGPGKVLLVAHSMGGLAIRCALATPCNKLTIPETAELVGNVGTVVTFGTPNEGSFLRGDGSDQKNSETKSLTTTAKSLCYGGEGLLGVGSILFEFFTKFCEHFEGVVDGKASNAFTPTSDALKRLAKLPGDVPITAVAATVRSETTHFYHDVDLGDLGDLVVSQKSAHAAVRPGKTDSKLTVDCGALNVSGLASLIPMIGPSIEVVNGGKIGLPDCWHGTETNDDRFLDHAKTAIDKWVADNTPATPTGLTADPLSGTSVRLSWNDVSSNEVGFRITVNGTPSPDALASNTLTTDVSGLKADTEYCFTVEAFNSAVKSAPSAPVCATPKEVPLATSVDWSDATYQTKCGDQVHSESSVTLSNGAGSTPNPEGQRPGATLDFELAATAVGDLTGDGHPEEAVVLWCHQSDTSPNFILWEIQVFTDGPTRMGVIVPTPDVGFGRVDFNYNEGQVSLVGNKLSVDVNLYGPDWCGACGNPVHGIYTWTWDGQQFVKTGGVEAAPPPDTSNPPTDLSGDVHGFIKAVDVVKSTITLDKVDWFEGAAATQACQEDGIGTDQRLDGWCSIYYYRNVNPALREVTVSPTATIDTFDYQSSLDPHSYLAITPSDLATVEARIGLQYPYDLSVTNGLVTSLREFYQP